MRIRIARSLAAPALLAAGLVAWPGCNAENPDGTPTTAGKIEQKAGEIEHKVVEGAKVAGGKIKEGASQAGEVIKEDAAKAGEAIKEGAEKIKEGAQHVGEKVKDSMPKKD